MGVAVRLFGDFDIRGVPLRVSAELGGEATVFEARLGDLTLGEVIRYVVGLAVPSLEVKLPPPWSVLESINLRDLVLRLDVTHGSVGVLYEHIDLDLGFLYLDRLELTYGGEAEDGGGAVDLKLFGRFLDRSYSYPDHPLSWDLLSEPPPQVPPGSSPAFRLDYLGLGQRVTLRDPSKLGDMETVIAALEAAGEAPDGPDPLRDLSTLRFDRSAGWLIGASFSVLGTFRLLAVFNDPTLYGMRVELAGERAKALAGLEFEILYRKVGPGLGVYHLELELPESMRHLEMGAVSITMPYLVLDVWTNGNFMVDLGFPHGLDFSRSFTLQTFVGPVPVIGAGGFYFGSLSSETSTAVPRISNGRFAPVLAFGIGLQIGVGRTIEMGMLRAGIVIAVEGLLEGVVAFFEPEDRGVDGDVWYRVRGTVALVGHIYGEVDFTVVKARVDLEAYASASATLEAYATTEVVLEAGVSAKLKVKVGFFHVHLSFTTRVRQSMTLGRAGHPPWRLDGGAKQPRLAAAGPGALTGSAARMAVDSAVLRSLEAPGALGTSGLLGVAGRAPAKAAVQRTWAGTRVAPEVRTLDLYLQPVVAVGSTADRPGAAADGDEAAVQVLALLFMPRGRDADGAAGFDDLAWAALQWAVEAVRAAGGDSLADAELDRYHLARAFHDLVESGEPERVGFCDVIDFLRENFQLRIRPLPDSPDARAALRDDGLTLFPVPPYLTVRAEQAVHEADLQHLNPCSPAYRTMIDEYFRRLHPDPPPPRPGRVQGPRFGGGETDSAADADALAPPDSMAAFVFADAARLILRGVLRAGLDAFGAWEAAAREGDRLADIAARYGVTGHDAARELALANRETVGFWVPGTILALDGLRVRVREAETPASLAGRVGLTVEALAGSAAAAAGLLRPGASVHVEGGQVTIREGDTVRSVAARLGTTVEALLAINPDLPWPPGPDGQDVLPAGTTVNVPIMDVRVEHSDTLARLADRLGLTAGALAALPENVDSEELLTPGASLPLPRVEIELGDADTPAGLARRLGLSVPDLVARADTAGATYGRVRIPDCRRLPADELRVAMRDRGAFDGVAGSLARFLLAGLRLPDPAAASQAAEPDDTDWSGLPLFPLYVLTGQQWTAADGDPATERVVLRRNPLDANEACQRPLITFESENPDESLTVGLGAEESALVQAYRKLVESGTPVNPQILAATRAAPYVVVPRRFALGEPVAWHAARVPDLGQGDDAGGDPVVLALPPALPALLRRNPELRHDPRLVLRPETSAGDAPATAREIEARAWATRVDFEIRRAPDPANPGTFLPSVVELFSTDGSARRRLLELVEHLRESPDRVARIHLLRPADPTSPDAGGMRSDAVDPADVVLLKTNLSTWTRPPAPVPMRAVPGEEPPAAEVPVRASLAEPLAFLELLWEAGVVAAGGFHLVYPVGDDRSLPPGLFGAGDTAKLSVLVVVSPSADSERSVAMEPFHDCVISVESTGDSVPVVEPPLFTVDAATTLSALAGTLGVQPVDLARANASTVGLVVAGSSLALPDVGPYVVQPGDDLMAPALLLDPPDLASVAAAVDAAGPVIPAGARGWTHPVWMAVRPTLDPGRIAFRILRTDPDPAPVRTAAGGAESSAQDDAATRLRTLYNLLDARVEAHGPFEASPRTLPVAPAEVERGDALNPLPVTPPAPWRYRRVLGLAGLADRGSEPEPSPGASDPYPGLGADALLSFRLLDVFGNRCLPDDAVPAVSVPIRYTDPLVGPGQWPGVAVAYRFLGGSSRRLELRASLDVGRTSPRAGMAAGPARDLATADRAVFAAVRRQLGREDLRITTASSIDGKAQPLERAELAAFAERVDRWLATIESLEEASHSVTAGATPASIAERWRVPLDALGRANAAVPGVLRTGAGTLRVPVLHSFARGDTLDGIVAMAGRDIAAGVLARRNRAVPLRPGAPLTVNGATVRVMAGATLASVAGDTGAEIPAIGEENAAVPDLFEPGTPLLVEVNVADIGEDATLAGLAAEHRLGVADLVAANAANDALLAEGARLAVPDHVRPGPESAATGKVRTGETLGALARRLGVPTESLVQANLAVDDLLAVTEPPALLEAVSRSGAVASTNIAEGDTLATALHRLRARPGCGDIGTAALARDNADRGGLLAADAIVLAPPRPHGESVPVAPDYDDVIFPLRVWLDLARDPELVDAALPPDSPVAGTRAYLSPALERPDGQPAPAGALDGFARDFREAFPELRLATASGADAAGGRPSLFAVQLQNQTVSWRVGSRPVFFAPRPLQVTRWSTPPGVPATVRPYTDGELGPPVERDIHDVDLDVWARQLLAGVERFLAADHAVTAQRVCAEAGSGAYDDVVRGKATLAAAIRDGVVSVLDPEEGEEAEEGDVDAAREALYQRVLADLEEAYRIDAIVQLPVTVHSPFQELDRAPRLYGRVVATTHEVEAGATLADVADAFDAPVELLVRMLARAGALLAEGATMEAGGKRHVVSGADTLATVADDLGVDLPTLARSVAGQAGLLRPGAPVDLVARSHTVTDDDSFGSVLETLADGGSLAGSVPVLAAMNADVPGLLLRDTTVTVETVPVTDGDTIQSIARDLGTSPTKLGAVNADTPDALRPGAVVEIGEARREVRNDDTLRTVAKALNVEVAWLVRKVHTDRQLLRPGALLRRDRPVTAEVGPGGRLGELADALGVPVEHVVATQLDTPELLREGTEVRWLARRPAVTLSEAKVPLADGACLTFAVRTSSARQSRRVALDPELRVTEIEYDIRDVPWAGAYQASEWLTLIEPLADAIHGMDVPVPLRTHPTPPVILGQEIRQPERADPEIADLRRYDYRLSYAYERAAQDELYFDAEVNVPDTLPMRMGADDRETLPFLLARYDAIAEPLWRDLASLRDPRELDGDAAGRAVVLGAIEVFADLVTRIGAAWGEWEPPGTVLRPPARLTAGGDRDPGDGEPIRIRHATTRTGEGGPSGAGLGQVHDLPHRDALRTQNIRGRVRVERNARLLTDRTTSGAFVYRVPPTGPASKAWPLLEHRAILRLEPTGPASIRDRLRELFGQLLGVTPDSPDGDGRPVRVAASWIFPLRAGDRAQAGNGREPALVAHVPVTLWPAAPFVPARDLTAEDGLCARLAGRLAAWVEQRGGRGDGELRLDLAAYANLPRTGGAGAKPLVELRDVRLPWSASS